MSGELSKKVHAVNPLSKGEVEELCKELQRRGLWEAVAKEWFSRELETKGRVTLPLQATSGSLSPEQLSYYG